MTLENKSAWPYCLFKTQYLFSAQWPSGISSKILALTALLKKTQIWPSSYHFLYFWYSCYRSFIWSDFKQLGWTSFMNIVSALITAFPPWSASGLMPICLDGAPYCLNLLTSCKIFIAKIHFSTHIITLSLKDLFAVRSVRWQIALAVEWVICVFELTWLFSWVIASFQVIITILIIHDYRQRGSLLLSQ